MTDEQAARLDALDDGAGTRYAGQPRIDSDETCTSCARPMNDAADVYCANLDHAGDCTDCGTRCTSGGSCPKCDAPDYADDPVTIDTNARFADHAEHAVDAHVKRTSTAYGTYHDAKANGEETDAIVADLLGDLQHFCDREGIDFAASLARGTYHYDEEKAGR